ncbi:MAG: autotransporter domain-containing protein [Fusobacteriaceae bacterium]|nr:autotransporter domain-containing protein [Fusobacteriaceae bacterium]
MDVTPAITAPTASDPTGSVINTGSYDVEFAGQITGTGTVEKAGSGELLLTGTNNDYTGNTTVTAGTLALKGAITASSVKVNSGTTFTAYQGAKIGGNLDASGATLNFYVPGTATDGDKILTVGGSADVSGSTVNVGIDGSSSALDTGDEIILIDAASRAGVPSNAKSSGTAMKGVTLQYDFELITNTTQLIAKLLTDTTSIVPPMGAGTLNPRVKALSEGYIAGISLINQGGDLIDPSKIQNFSYDFEGFAIMNGGSSRYNTGSHVDLKSFSVVAGVTKGKEVSGGKLMFGGFFEYGTGSYDTYNSFTSLASVRGDGDLSYFGGGILGRMDFKPVKSGNFYLEGSLRAGRIKNKYSSKDLQSVIGTIAAYSKTDGYAGFHLGAGYRWNITEKTELDLYTKYFYTKEKGDHVILSTGDDIHFKDVTSSRIRIGGRLSGNGEKVKPYAGLAWEYEGDGKARATTSGLKIGTPSLTGSTGIAELGVKLTPSPKWTLDIGIQGYVGEREGVTGSLRVKYVF